jgi:STIP1 family protein 1
MKQEANTKSTKMNCSNVSSSSTSSNKYKEEGNKLFMKRNYKEAIEMYTKALEKSMSSTHYTNRALCYFKLQQWSTTIEDCKRAIELDPHSVKAYFFMGQSMCELYHFDEGIVHLKRAHELTKELNENYGDEITRTIRNSKRRRWNYLEEKRIKKEIDLQVYLNRLMLEDKQKQINKIRSNSKFSSGAKLTADLDMIASANDQPDSLIVVNNAAAANFTTENTDENEKQIIANIENDFQQRYDELNRLFNENDARRRKREIPDFLCGKISFELMNDPVITPSGITYDRNDIEQHLHKVGRFDPVTRTELTIDQLIPNLAIKEVIENFVNENEWIDGAL